MKSRVSNARKIETKSNGNFTTFDFLVRCGACFVDAAGLTPDHVPFDAVSFPGYREFSIRERPGQNQTGITQTLIFGAGRADASGLLPDCMFAAFNAVSFLRV